MTQRIVPMIAYEDAASTIDWLDGTFGFAERVDQRYTDDSAVMTHAELDLEGATVYVSTPTPEYVSPRRHRETCEIARRSFDNPWVIDGVFVEVEDVGAHHARAVAAGAEVLREPEEPGIEYRIYSVEDLEGHRSMFGQRLEDGE